MAYRATLRANLLNQPLKAAVKPLVLTDPHLHTHTHAPVFNLRKFDLSPFRLCCF